MKKVLILAPRLDVNFKYNPAIKSIPETKGPILPEKALWNDFLQCTQNICNQRGIELVVLEKALWQFNPSQIKDYDVDYVLVPHKESHNFPVTTTKAYYYMQTTFPWIFTVDPVGWAGGASVHPYSSIMPSTTDRTMFDNLKARALNNQSKFSQPDYKDLDLPDHYVLFACQIPNDETILYHSKVNVGKALIYTCEATKKLGIPLVVKGHPANPSSMIGLKNSLQGYNHVKWFEKVSIHQLIEKSKCVVVVNSGVGMEALLHGKPVVTFGQAEYDCVTNHADKNNLDSVLNNLVYDEDKVIRFFDGWYNWAYDTTRIESFQKLP